MMESESVLELQQLYRFALAQLVGAESDFVEDMPLDVLSGMFGPSLRQELQRLTFWPVMHASTSSFVHTAPLVAPEVLAILDTVQPIVDAHDRVFEDGFLPGFMTDAGVRQSGNPHARALLQLSFRLTGVWSTSNRHFRAVHDAVQLLTFCEMMTLSHGTTVLGWFKEAPAAATLARMRAHIAVLADLRGTLWPYPLPQEPTATIEWLRDNLHRPGPQYRLVLPGVFETA